MFVNTYTVFTKLNQSRRRTPHVTSFIRHPDIRVKHCAYGHSFAALITHVVLQQFPAVTRRNCGSGCSFYRTLHRYLWSENILFKMKFKSINKRVTLIIYYNCLNYLLTKHSLTTTLRFIKENICTMGDRNGSKSSYWPVLHSYIWMRYSNIVLSGLVLHCCGKWVKETVSCFPLQEQTISGFTTTKTVQYQGNILRT
jgi:hypothetical protein